MRTFFGAGKPWLALVMLSLALTACGGAGGGTVASPPVVLTPTPTPTPTPTVARGTLLANEFSTYPRLVRQSFHSNAALNGRLVASVSASTGGANQAAIYASADEGKTFARIGSVTDNAFQKGLCCGTLFELPSAIGALPAGTLLYAASVGADGTVAMENRIYQSGDGGVSWTYLSNCGRGLVPKTSSATSGIWEPEFAIAANGELACFYSDETEPKHSQVLKLTHTADGLNWSTPTLVVAGDDPNDRPGMAIVRRLPSGRFFMTWEQCYGGPLNCAVRAKSSADGLNWGVATDIGQRLETASGQFFRHAPTLSWSPSADSANGQILVIGQILVQSNGVADASANGHAMFVNTTADGSGPWRLVNTPIGVPNPPTATNWCQNYSTPLLPSKDGKSLAMMVSDGGADSSCRVYFGSGSF